MFDSWDVRGPPSQQETTRHATKPSDMLGCSVVLAGALVSFWVNFVFFIFFVKKIYGGVVPDLFHQKKYGPGPGCIFHAILGVVLGWWWDKVLVTQKLFWGVGRRVLVIVRFFSGRSPNGKLKAHQVF